MSRPSCDMNLKSGRSVVRMARLLAVLMIVSLLLTSVGTATMAETTSQALAEAKKTGNAGQPDRGT